MKKSRAGVV